MQETESIDEYILQHIDPESDYLKALYRDTHVKLLRPRMASGHLQGRMLKMFVKMIRPRQILEIGTYSGYSALCLAEGLSEGGMLHTFEINDEQEDFTRPWLEKSPFADKIRFYMAPILIGGKDAPGAIGGTGAALIPEAVQLENIRTERSGVDLVVEGYVKKRKKVPAERPLPEKFKADISGKKGSTAVENEIRDQEPEKMQEEIKEPAEMEKAAEKMAEAQEARLPEGQA